LKTGGAGSLPSMVDKRTGAAISETNAILRYLAIEYGDGHGYSKLGDQTAAGKQSKARNDRASADGLEYVCPTMQGCWDYLMGKEPPPVEEIMAKMDRAAEAIEDALPAGKRYIGGDAPSVADYSMAVYIFSVINPALCGKMNMVKDGNPVPPNKTLANYCLALVEYKDLEAYTFDREKIGDQGAAIGTMFGMPKTIDRDFLKGPTFA